MAIVGLLPGGEYGEGVEEGVVSSGCLGGYFYARNSLPGEPQNAGVGFDSPGFEKLPVDQVLDGQAVGYGSACPFNMTPWSYWCLTAPTVWDSRNC